MVVKINYAQTQQQVRGVFNECSSHPRTPSAGMTGLLGIFTWPENCRSIVPSPEKIAQKTTFLPAFGAWVGYRSSGSRARRGDYK